MWGSAGADFNEFELHSSRLLYVRQIQEFSMASVTRRTVLASSVASVIALENFPSHVARGDQANSSPPSLGRATPTETGFEGVRLQIVAADDFTPVPSVWVSVTCIGHSISETRTSGQKTDANGIVTFNLKHEIPGPYIVDLRPPDGSRFCPTSFHTPEHLLTIQEDGRYFPQMFRITFRETTWKEMTGLGPRNCD
jgi:hypothetical protein